MASPSSQFCFLFCSLVLLVLIFQITPSLAKTSFKPTALVLPVTKDSSTLQYVISGIQQRTPLVPLKLTLDLGGEHLWVDCEQGYVSTYKPALCNSSPCKLARARLCTTCNFSPTLGCNNNTCDIFPDNPLAEMSIGSGNLGQDVLSLQTSDGSHLGTPISVPNFIFSCGATSLLDGLSSGVTGMAGFGRDKIALPFLFSSAFGLPKKFAICLSSSTKSKGAILFGDGPYVLSPGIDVSDSSTPTFTKLVLNPVSTASASFEGDPSTEYFIQVKAIKINDKVVSLFNTSLLKIDNGGIGGTKISTLKPYTVLETSIYNAVVNEFVKLVSGHMPRVKAMPPFGACFNSKNIGRTRVAPRIDLVLSKGAYWRVAGDNLMVQVSKVVSCLGFVDSASKKSNGFNSD